MSIEALTIALHHSRAKGTDKLVLLGIANHFGDNGAYPNMETLGRYAGVSERSVRRSIQELQKLGEIHVYVNGAPIGGQYKPNLYWVTLTCPPECDRSMNHKLRADIPDHQGGHVRPSGRTQMSSKPVIEPVREPIHPQAKLEGFDDFWNLYPRKVEKLAAQRAYAKALTIVKPEDILEGVTRLANDPNLPPKQFIPHPATWLNGGGWENEPYPERILTPDEAKQKAEAERLARKERDRELVKAEQARLRLEEEEARQRAATVRKCHHGRVAAICDACSRDQTAT